ncbi:hypothetical protein NQ315_006955 [Exocentrus adspersus]|uniref:Uncharacterized protein n=1 Tax=Exocentrus adspersus TaxID=1586481 RepID=A0AAV8WD36_9CUCU|nr:hypothetical protein NQ315_006955 [Exocentrus adspersus]
MKTFVVAVVLVAAVAATSLPDAEKALLKKLHETCQSKPETHADDALLKKFSDNLHDDKVMHHMTCIAKGAGMVTEGGTIDKTVMKKKVGMVMEDQHAVDEVVMKCGVDKENDKETAMHMWMCFKENHVHYMPEF